jgi:serine/threonine-protein kinase SRPK3
VWLAFNFKDKRLYALKIMRSQGKYQEHGMEEEAINRVIAENHDNPVWLKTIKERIRAGQGQGAAGGITSRDHTHCLQMYDWFFHHSINGRHFVMGFEVLGKNLLNLIKKYNYRGIPIPLVREITK